MADGDIILRDPGETAGNIAFIDPTAVLTGSTDSIATVTGTLGAVAGLVGAVAGVASVTGTVLAVVSLSGSVSGQASASGATTAVSALSGAVAGVGSTFGAIDASTGLTGAAASSSAVTGAMAGVASIAGSSACAATVTGNLAIASIGAVGFITLPVTRPLYTVLLPAVQPLYAITIPRIMGILHIGDTALLSGILIRDADTVLINPDTFECVVNPPLGTNFTLTYGVTATSGSGDVVARPATGTFDVQVSLTPDRGTGIYRYKIVTTGAKAVEEGWFRVEPSRV